MQLNPNIAGSSGRAVGFTPVKAGDLRGDLEEAKGVIAKHLEAYPEKKDMALKDEDLVAIRDFIETL